MCKHLEISRAAYYKWLHREIPDAEHENIKLAELIKEYDARFNHILGYRRMTSWINHFNHTKYSKNRVHRIMKKLGIHSVIRKKKKKYVSTRPDEVAENILQRNFYATSPNQKWATDVTEFKIPGGKKKLYLSAIIDLYDRFPVAHVISARNDNRLVFKTFDKAISANPDAKPIFHSDRGFQYTSKMFKKKLEKQGMEQSAQIIRPRILKARIHQGIGTHEVALCGIPHPRRGFDTRVERNRHGMVRWSCDKA